MYSEFRIPRLAATLWRSEPEEPLDEAPAESLIVPDGCMDLIVLDAEVVVAGADSTARAFRGARQTAVGLRFDPGVLPQLLATSAAELANAITPLDAVTSLDAITPLDAVTSLGSVGNSDRPVDRASRALLGTARMLADRTELNPLPMAFASSLRRSPSPSIAEVAAHFAYSPRQLRRLSADWFGYGPKHLAKVLRWQAARRLIAAGQTKTAAAAAAGYSDAAHLWRDEQALLGR